MKGYANGKQFMVKRIKRTEILLKGTVTSHPPTFACSTYSDAENLEPASVQKTMRKNLLYAKQSKTQGKIYFIALHVAAAVN